MSIYYDANGDDLNLYAVDPTLYPVSGSGKECTTDISPKTKNVEVTLTNHARLAGYGSLYLYQGSTYLGDRLVYGSDSFTASTSGTVTKNNTIYKTSRGNSIYKDVVKTDALNPSITVKVKKYQLDGIDGKKLYSYGAGANAKALYYKLELNGEQMYDVNSEYEYKYDTLKSDKEYILTVPSNIPTSSDINKYYVNDRLADG